MVAHVHTASLVPCNRKYLIEWIKDELGNEWSAFEDNNTTYDDITAVLVQ